MNRLARVVLLAIVFVPTAAAAQAPAAGGVRRLKLSSSAVDFAFDPSSGGLAAVDAGAAKVLVYPREWLDGDDKQKPTSIKVGRDPISATFKRFGDATLLAVVCQGDETLHVVDPSARKLVKRLTLSAGAPRRVVASTDPDDPFLYVACERPHGHALIRVHLKRFKEQHVMNLESPRIEISADGQYLYCLGTFAHGSVQAYLTKRVDSSASPIEASPTGAVESSFSSIAPDALGQCVAIGDQLWSADLRTRIKRLDFAPACSFPDRPVVVGWKADAFQGGSGFFHARELDEEDWKLRAASANTYSVATVIELPGVVRPPPPDSDGGFSNDGFGMDESDAPQVFADSNGKRVLVCALDQVLSIPLKSFDLPDEPLLYARVAAPSVAIVDQAFQARVELLSKGARIELSGAPDGAKLENGVLSWTPDDADIGEHELVLRVTDGGLDRVQSIHVEVARPHARLDFVPSGLEVSPDGKWALAWHNGVDETMKSVARIAVIDVAKGEVTRLRTMPNMVGVAAIDAQHVYLSSVDSNSLSVLNRQELTDKQRLFSDAPIASISLVVPDNLYMTSHDGVERLFTLPDLKPAPTDRPRVSDIRDFHLRARGLGAAPPRLLPDGIFFRGTLFDAEMKSPRLRLTNGVAAQVNGLAGWDAEEDWTLLAPWGREPPRGGGGFFGGAPWQDGRRAVMVEFPIEAELARLHKETRTSVSLILRDLLTGAAVDTMLLASVPPDRLMLHQAPESESRVVAQGPLVLAAVGNRVFLHRVTKQQGDAFPVPFAFRMVQEQFVVASKGATTLKHEFRGGEAPWSVELDPATSAVEEVSIDASSGQVTIDAPKLRGQAISAASTGIRNLAPEKSHAKAIDEYMAAVGQLFADTVGREPNGVPVSLRVGLAARDATQQSAKLVYQVWMEVPRDDVVAALDNMDQGANAPLADLGSKRPRGRAANEDNEEGLEARVGAIEKRLERLEAQIQLLIEVIGEGRNAPPANEEKKRPATDR